MQSLSNGIRFSIDNGLPSITLPKPLDKASQEELHSLERFSNVSNLFQNVFDVHDHTRWMVIERDAIKVQFIPGKAGKNAPNNNDIARKVAGMLHMLQNRDSELLHLDQETAAEIEEKALFFLTGFSTSEQPLLQNYKWTNIHSALRLLSGPLKIDLETIPDCLEKAEPPKTCKVFCNQEIINRQLISVQKLHNVLTNSLPYVDAHVMIVTKACRRASDERNAEEITEKYELILRITLIFQDRFHCSHVGVITREGTMAGQTQPHLHDHVVGFNPQTNGDQLWMRHWRDELSNKTVDTKPATESVKRIKEIMPNLFQPIKAIVFDIGGVVVKQHNKEVEWLETICPVKYGELLKPLTDGEIDEELFWINTAQQCGFKYDDTFRQKWKEIYLDSNPISEKVVRTINKLRELNLKVFALSNTIPSHCRFNQERNLPDLFDGMVNSHEVGMSKPNQKIYEELTEFTELRPEEHLFVDDRAENVLAAQGVGMHAFLWDDEDRGIERIRAYLNS